MTNGERQMLKKKYYDGTQIHRIISEEVKDYDTIMKILKRFADEPSAQPMRPKGKWIQEELAYGGIPYHCDQCGVELWDTVLGTPRWNFCPNCGAEMEVEHE